MDLIFANENKEELGVLFDYEFDLAYGKDENNFELKLQSSQHCCHAGYYIYIEGTEYGGIVDSIESDNEKREVVYIGRTWQGVLNSKVIAPDSGAAYLTVSGEANTVIGELLTRLGLTGLFEASSVSSGLTVSSYKMNRYIEGYDGIKKMLDTVDATLSFTYQGGKILLTAIPKTDYTQNESFDSDQVEFTARKSYKTVNHLICLGSGELENRMVIHLYADTAGNISQTQSLFGLDEYATVFDYPNVESEEELLSSGKARLKSLWNQDKLSIDLDANSAAYKVGDIVGATDNITGITVTAEIIKKIVTINNGKITISYKVGE